MSWKNMLCALPVLIVCISICMAAEITSDSEIKMEESTVSPIADMVMVSDTKISTEGPAQNMETVNGSIKEEGLSQADTQRHTVADFIIHPLIAFKPRAPEGEHPLAIGRQSDLASTTTPSPWQIFGFNAGQGLGSLAGTVTGWINDRIQLPGLVDTPVRETTTTTSSTSTTTTPRPDVVVRVQQRTTTRRPPFISIANNNRPHRFNSNHFDFDSDEIDDEEYDDNFPHRRFNRRRFQGNNDLDDEDDDTDSQEYVDRRKNSNQDDEDDADDDNTHNIEDEEEEQSDEEEDDHENLDGDEENYSQRPNNRRRPLRNNNQRRDPNKYNYRSDDTNFSNNRRRQPQNLNENDEESSEGDFFYDNRPSTKRSQSPNNFIQRGQQSLINQIRQLTRVQSPAEIGTIMRQPLTAAAMPSKTNRQQAATLFINRNGQTVYMAPELAAATPQYQLYGNNVAMNLRAGQFPQPPLTKPLRIKGQPTQYITIPWNQLGISPPNRISKLATDLQSEPHILNIPQSAINAMQTPNRKSIRPIITADAVPLLAEASLMDIFQPPQIPPSRSSALATSNIVTKGTNILPNAAVITAKANKPSVTATPIVVVPQRIRGGTIIEKAPAIEKDTVAESSEHIQLQAGSTTKVRNAENEYILVGEDNDQGVTRQVQPVFGDARYVRVSDVQPYFEVLQPRARHSVRKTGRAIPHSDSEDVKSSHSTRNNKDNASEQLIPVEIIRDIQNVSQASQSDMILREAEQKVVEDGAAVADISQRPVVKT